VGIETGNKGGGGATKIVRSKLGGGSVRRREFSVQTTLVGKDQARMGEDRGMKKYKGRIVQAHIKQGRAGSTINVNDPL